MPPIEDLLPIVLRNVRLRRLQPGDLCAFQAYRSDQDLARYQGWSAMSEPEATQFIAEMSGAALFRPNEWIQLAIADIHTDQLLGDVGLYLSPDGSMAEVGFTVAREAQGRGIATAAGEAVIALVLERTAVSKVVGITDARNSPSINLLTRLGMRQRESREAVFKGEECIELVFSIER